MQIDVMAAGKSRLFIVFVLFVLNVFMAGVVTQFFMPETTRLSREVSKTERDLRKTKADVRTFKEKYQEIEAEKEKYNALIKNGFFGGQDRARVRDLFDSLQDVSHVFRATYTVSPALFEKNENIRKAGHVILNSPVTVRVDAIDDIDIYRFIHLIEDRFPGHTEIRNIRIVKDREVTQSVLRAIGNNTPVRLVGADISFNWRTVIPEEAAEEEGEGR